MSDPTVVKVEPPVATTLGECDPTDIVEFETGERAVVVERFAYVGSVAVLIDGKWRRRYTDLTPVLLVARIHLGEGRGK